MDKTVFIITIVTLGLCSLGLGLRSRAEKAVNNESYLLANRRLGIISLALSLLATQLGGGVILGSAEAAFELGIAAFFYPLGLVLGLLLSGLLIAGKFRTLNVKTLAEIFERCYGSRVLRKFSAFVSIVSLFIILVAMGIAAKKFFISLGVTNPFLYPFIWLVLLFYTVNGGLLSVVKTDILQVVFIIIAFVLVTIFSWEQISTISWTTQISTFNDAKISWNSWVLMPMLYLLCEQTMAQRCVAAQSAKSYVIAAMMAAGLLFVLAMVPTAFGILAQGLEADIPANASRLMLSVEYNTGPYVTAIFSCAIFMAIISTADSLIGSIMVNLSYDFLDELKWVEIKKIRMNQALAIGLGLLALAISYLFDNVMSALILSYEFSVCCLSVPILVAIFRKNNPVNAAFLAVGFGTMGFIYFKLMPGMESLPKEMLTLLLSGLGYLIGCLVPARSREVLSNV